MEDNQKQNNYIYHLGKRDAYAELFMYMRTQGVTQTLKDVAEELKDNPHAQWFLTHGNTQDI